LIKKASELIFADTSQLTNSGLLKNILQDCSDNGISALLNVVLGGQAWLYLRTFSGRPIELIEGLKMLGAGETCPRVLIRPYFEGFSPRAIACTGLIDARTERIRGLETILLIADHELLVKSTTETVKCYDGRGGGYPFRNEDQAADMLLRYRCGAFATDYRKEAHEQLLQLTDALVGASMTMFVNMGRQIAGSGELAKRGALIISTDPFVMLDNLESPNPE
jgi:hypothetical protein